MPPRPEPFLEIDPRFAAQVAGKVDYIPVLLRFSSKEEADAFVPGDGFYLERRFELVPSVDGWVDHWAFDALKATPGLVRIRLDAPEKVI